MGGYSEAVRLVDARTARAIVETVQGDLDRFDAPETPDPTIVALLETPFHSIVEAAAHLDRLERHLQAREDRRAVFLTIYATMTRAVHDGVEDGAFADPEWMGRYLVTFANYYRRAFLAFERGHVERVPDPWRIAFGTAIRGDALVIQDAFLGVNAHINYDLALTLEDVGIDPDRPAKYADHRAINEILARLVDVQQEALAETYAAGVEDLDGVLGGFDETATLMSMTEGREQAWRIAVILTDVGLSPVTRFAHWVLRVTATGGAYVLLGPQLDPALLDTLRRVEQDGLALDDVLDHVRNRLEDAR